jgi:citrate synthase
MKEATFSDTLFLLHQSRLPTAGERRLIDAILIGAADHGPGSPSAAAARIVASGNRQAPEAAVAAGVLAIGDQHAGAGEACMALIDEGVRRMEADGVSLEASAERTALEARAARARLPGLGHRVHSTIDPRTAVLFDLAKANGTAGRGIEFMRALEAAVSRLVKPLPINIDGALAAVLCDLGFSPRFGKFIFIMGRVAGLTAQVTEEYERERPMRIRIPVAYDGVAIPIIE